LKFPTAWLPICFFIATENGLAAHFPTHVNLQKVLKFAISIILRIEFLKFVHYFCENFIALIIFCLEINYTTYFPMGK